MSDGKDETAAAKSCSKQGTAHLSDNTITSETRLRRTIADFVDAEVDDELVFMDVERGRFYGIKDTGRATWELIDEDSGWCRLGEIVSALCREFEVDGEACLRDLATFLGELEEAGLVELAR